MTWLVFQKPIVWKERAMRKKIEFKKLEEKRLVFYKRKGNFYIVDLLKGSVHFIIDQNSVTNLLFDSRT